MTIPVGKVIALDSETTGLRAYHGDRPFLWCYFTEKGEHGWIEHGDEFKAWVTKLMMDPSRKLVFHNAKFDMTMMGVEGLPIFDAVCEFHCTLIQSKLFNENGDHDLASCGRKYVGRDPGDKEVIDVWFKAEKRRAKAEGRPAPTFADAPREAMIRRCLWDVETTIRLFYFFNSTGHIDPQLYATERRLLLVTIDMERVGVEVDISRAKALRSDALRAIGIMQAEINKLVCPLRIKRDRKGKPSYMEVITDFNPGSTAIQMPAAFQKLGIELKYKTKPSKDKAGMPKGGGRWSFDETSMNRYAHPAVLPMMKDSSEEGWPFDKFWAELNRVIEENGLTFREAFIPTVMKRQELAKMVSTYYDHIIEDATERYTTPTGQERGVIHCRFNQAEAMTGRFSASEPNLQNMPRLLGPRECFIPRRGRVNIHADYDQVEMKFFVHFSEDPVMREAVAQDIHRATAARVLKKPREDVTDEQRKRAKATNFGILYGSGAETQAETLTSRGLPTTREEAAVFIAAYHQAFPSIRRLTTKLKTQLIRDGFVENPFGRKYHIPTKFGYKALNYMCQGTSADLMKVGLVRVWEALRVKTKTGRLLKTVHDEVVVESSRIEAPLVVQIMRECMEDHDSFLVPITVGFDVVTRRWSEKFDLEEAGISNLN